MSAKKINKHGKLKTLKDPYYFDIDATRPLTVGELRKGLKDQPDDQPVCVEGVGSAWITGFIQNCTDEKSTPRVSFSLTREL